jgi:phosphate transport system substrate-binding protein
VVKTQLLVAALVSSSALADPVLNGSGSIFQKPLHEVAIDAYSKTATVHINYGGGGSGKGRQDLADMVVEFAGTDAPYKDADLKKAKGGDVLYIPVLLGPIAVSYHVDVVGTLRLSPQTLAKIFQRQITMWNDRAIAADNPGVGLPATPIVIVHRSDGAVTTTTFTTYLANAAGSAWKLGSGSTVEWPEDALAGNGNAGVATQIRSTKGAIGYLDLADAKASTLAYATIKNRAGKYVAPSTDSATAAADGVEIKPDLTFSALDARGALAYPITYPSWVIVYAQQTDRAKGTALRDYLEFLLDDGQGMLKPLDLAPLPSSLRDQALKQLNKMVVP